MVINNLYFETIEIVKPNTKSNILFIHGFTSNFNKHLFISKYLPNDISFYALNLPGSQDTPAYIKMEHTRESYANIIAEYVKKLDLKNIIVVAHSMGGSITAFLSELIPDRIIGYFLEAPENESILNNESILIDPREDKFDISLHKIKNFFSPAKKENNEEDKEEEITDKNKAINTMLKKIIKKPLSLKIYWNLGIKENIEKSITKTNKLFKNIKKPIVILLAKDDHIILYENAYNNFHNLKNRKIKIKTIINSGHSIYIDQKRKYIYYLLWFIKKNKFSNNKINYKQFI